MIKISIVIVSVSFNFYNVGTFKQNYRIIPSIFLSDDYHRSIVYCKIMRIDKTDLQIPLEESWSRNGNLIRLVFWSTLCLILLFFWIELAVFLLQSPLCTIFVHIHNLRCVPLIFDEFAKSRSVRACVPTWSTCQNACLPAWFTCQRAESVPTSHFYVSMYHTACHCFKLACQIGKRCANFSNIPLTKC